MGLSVVRESLGRAMLRCRILTGAHFVFGGAYLVYTWTSSVLTLFFSFIRSGDRGIAVRVHVGFDIAIVCHSIGLHPERVYVVDYVRSSW